MRVRRIDLPDEVTDSVYRRMEQSFKAQAAKLRAEGQATAEGIRAGADRERTEILAAAAARRAAHPRRRRRQATDIYARTYGRNPEFYTFYRSLQAYRNSLGREQDVLVHLAGRRVLPLPGAGRRALASASRNDRAETEPAR